MSPVTEVPPLAEIVKDGKLPSDITLLVSVLPVDGNLTVYDLWAARKDYRGSQPSEEFALELDLPGNLSQAERQRINSNAQDALVTSGPYPSQEYEGCFGLETKLHEAALWTVIVNVYSQDDPARRAIAGPGAIIMIHTPMLTTANEIEGLVDNTSLKAKTYCDLMYMVQFAVDAKALPKSVLDNYNR